MTKEEFKRVMSSLNVERNTIESEMRKMQQKYADSYPIKEGDVCTDENGNKCWFKRLQFTHVGADYAIAIVNYPKKDGTRSNRDLHACGKLTKVEE